MDETVAVLVPVKAFALAKVRLADVITPADRTALVRSMAETVLRAAAPLPVAVVTDDGEAAAWAEALGATVVLAPGQGLNRAVALGVSTLAAAGAQQVIVAHADLPLARSLAWVGDHPGITLVPDRRDDGTNVLCVPTDIDFTFSYGAGSFVRHRAEAARHGCSVRLARDRTLSWDVDVPADLAYSATA